MKSDPRSPIETLVHFSQRVSDALTPEDVLPLLADAAIRHLSADAAGVLGVTESGGVRMMASRGLPEALRGFCADPEALGADLGSTLSAACAGRFPHASSLPLVNSGDLYGELWLFFAAPVEWDRQTRELAEALVNLAAIAMGKGYQYAALRRSLDELRASREALAQSEKLRALGQMAAGVSHDLKNILNPLLLQVQVLKRKALRGEDAAPVVERMERVLHRGVETVERLRSFSRQAPEAAMEPADLNALVREALEICGPRLRSQPPGAELRVAEERAVVQPVTVQAAEVVSAILNLLVNALDAMPGGGVITVSTGSSDGGAWVRVADNGPGIPPELEARLFEPFFTTKGQDGTGLGLSMVYALMRRHGGVVTLDNRPGEGAAFTLWFPGPPAG